MPHQRTWLLQSPDLNLFEMVWEEIDRRVKAKGSPSSQHFWDLLQHFWKTIAGDYLMELIERIPKVKPKDGYFNELQTHMF